MRASDHQQPADGLLFVASKVMFSHADNERERRDPASSGSVRDKGRAGAAREAEAKAQRGHGAVHPAEGCERGAGRLVDDLASSRGTLCVVVAILCVDSYCHRYTVLMLSLSLVVTGGF